MFEEETERSVWKRRQNLREQVFGKMQVKKNPEISELNAFHWNSIFIFLLILDVLFFLSGFSSDTVASPLNVKANVRVQFVIALNHGLYVKRMATPFLESNATTLAGYILYFMY